MNDHFSVFVCGELGDAAFNVSDWDQWSAKVRDWVLVRLADVEDKDVFLSVHLLLECLDADLGDTINHWSLCYYCVAGYFQWSDCGWFGDAAELVVVYQGGDGGVCAADRTVGVLA